MKKEIVFATNNKKKLEEISLLLEKEWKILSLSDLNFHDEIDETGKTFHENASIKARIIADNFGINCFADDSGLVVSALNGEPGIYSGRYAGEPRSDLRNNELLLKKLETAKNRSAYFNTCICLVTKEKEYFFEGKINGEILTIPTGNSGFGYDPVFKPEGFDISFAQMNIEQKNKISHRAIAVNKLVDFLKSGQCK
ncbi:MAG: RdgB/HAM1 family non-canonical purine NTP pyrophosphatase [Bacteroidota bacterium]